jgi:hypothetical protein
VGNIVILIIFKILVRAKTLQIKSLKKSCLHKKVMRVRLKQVQVVIRMLTVTKQGGTVRNKVTVKLCTICKHINLCAKMLIMII